MESLGENVAFIPLRGGSKSIIDKNIKRFNGRPLVYWCLDAVAQCNEIDNIVVSTDSDEIRKVIMNYKGKNIKLISRSEEVSSDEASTESVMLEFAEKYMFENIILVQATSPLLKLKDIKTGLTQMADAETDSVLSVVRQKRFVWKEETENTVIPVNYDYNYRPRRQEFSGYIVENGAFYITTRERLLKSRCRLSGRIKAVEMEEDTYLEIDEPVDWIVVEAIHKRSNKNIIYDKIRNIKCLLVDCDGVLTDGGMYYADNGDELKKFNTKDGMGFNRLNDFEYITGIITGEDIELVKRRAEKMNLNECFTGVKNKVEVLNLICEKYRLNYEQVAYIGDDINDFDILNKVGLACSPSDAHERIIGNVDYVSKKKGGQGVVRDVVDLILKYKDI